MSDPPPTPKVSNRISPLAVIVAIILIGIVIMAVVKRHGHHVSASGVAAPEAASNGVMPQQPHLPNAPAPAANTNDAVEASPSGAGGSGNTAG